MTRAIGRLLVVRMRGEVFFSESAGAVVGLHGPGGRAPARNLLLVDPDSSDEPPLEVSAFEFDGTKWDFSWKLILSSGCTPYCASMQGISLVTLCGLQCWLNPRWDKNERQSRRTPEMAFKMFNKHSVMPIGTVQRRKIRGMIATVATVHPKLNKLWRDCIKPSSGWSARNGIFRQVDLPSMGTPAPSMRVLVMTIPMLTMVGQVGERQTGLPSHDIGMAFPCTASNVRW